MVWFKTTFFLMEFLEKLDSGERETLLLHDLDKVNYKFHTSFSKLHGHLQGQKYLKTKPSNLPPKGNDSWCHRKCLVSVENIIPHALDKFFGCIRQNINAI